MNFNEAQQAVMNGKFITRQAWTNGQYLYWQKGTVLNMEQVAELKSMPTEVKQEILDSGESQFEFGGTLMFKHGNYAIGFLPLIDDITTQDWYELG